MVRRHLRSGKKELKENKDKFNKNILEAEKELNNAKEDIKNIKEPVWYILTRDDSSGIASFLDAVDSMNNIAKLFPVVFYVVAILISLTSMTRMVEEERIEIGTLKALGYTNFQIMIKYILYSMFACILGGTIGMYIGSLIIPNIVWKNYSIIYYLPEFYSDLRYFYGIIGIIIALVCICGATIQSIYKELKNQPSILMRPKIPKAGKRVVIEKIPFIWKKLSFSMKTTIRNLFRYKKKALMTIIGIAGCTTLILAGFGLKDSITDIADLQYGRIFNYDMTVSLKNQNKEIIDKIKNDKRLKTVVTMEGISGTIRKDINEKDVSVLIIENPKEFEKVANLYDIKSKNKNILDENSIMISDKLASILNIVEGDIIEILDNDNNKFNYKVSKIVENYIGHYVFISKNLYEKVTNNKYKTNMMFIKNKEEYKNTEKINEISKEFLDNEDISSVIIVDTTLNHVKDMLKSLNLVVMILIVSSALLAFVVLYNLSNVNISERIREIATLKVLGFYDREVDNYINRESLILTFIGIVIGLIAGYFLTGVIITTCEIDNMRFGRNILPISYIYSVLITGLFSIIVNYVTHFVLKKVNMVESLKTIE